MEENNLPNAVIWFEANEMDFPIVLGKGSEQRLFWWGSAAGVWFQADKSPYAATGVSALSWGCMTVEWLVIFSLTVFYN